MTADDPPVESSRSVEDLHHLQLMASLYELVREKDQKGAAEVLGVDPRTLATSFERRALSRRVRAALERMLASGGGPVAARQQERIEALEQRAGALEERIGALEKGPGGGPGEAGQGDEGHGAEDAAQTVRELARRVSRLERVQAARRAPPDGWGPAREPPPEPAVRPQPGVVAGEPQPGDGDAYGPGMPLVEEWRALTAGRGDGDRITRVRTRERIMELEIAMIGEHGLTLPPDTVPLHPSQREGYLDWRRRALEDIRRERARRELLRWVRRALTLGLWWR